MALPTVALLTPDESIFKVANPALEFVGSDSDGDDLSYQVSVDRKTLEYSPATTPFVNNIAYGNGMFVASSSGSNVLYSYDGLNWNTSTLPSNTQSASVAFGNGVFVLVSSAYSPRLFRSTDGINWVASSNSINAYFTSVTYGNGLFVAVSNNWSQFATSPDGVVWTARTIPATRQYMRIVFGNGIFVALASNSGVNTILTSPDGITWTQQVTSSLSWSDVAYGDGVFVAVRSKGASGQKDIMWSTDGVTWTEVTTVYSSSFSFTRIIYYNGRFVVYGINYIYVSWDRGLTWQNYSTLLSPAYTLFNSAYGNDRVVFSGNANPPAVLHTKVLDSQVDSGFTNLSNPADTDPFTQGDTIKLVGVDRTYPGDYTWAVRAKDSSAGSTWGTFANRRSFSVVQPVNPGAFFQLLR